MSEGTMGIFMILFSILCMCLTFGISIIAYLVAHLKGYYKGLGVLHRINDEVDSGEEDKEETEKER